MLEQGKMTAHLSQIDVVIDVAQVLGHLGVDADLTPIAHDAYLHDATVSVTHQRTTVIPLRKHKTRALVSSLSGPIKDTCFQLHVSN